DRHQFQDARRGRRPTEEAGVQSEGTSGGGAVSERGRPHRRRLRGYRSRPRANQLGTTRARRDRSTDEETAAQDAAVMRVSRAAVALLTTAVALHAQQLEARRVAPLVSSPSIDGPDDDGAWGLAQAKSPL